MLLERVLSLARQSRRCHASFAKLICFNLRFLVQNLWEAIYCRVPFQNIFYGPLASNVKTQKVCTNRKQIRIGEIVRVVPVSQGTHKPREWWMFPGVSDPLTPSSQSHRQRPLFPQRDMQTGNSSPHWRMLPNQLFQRFLL
jgi:hypothetical protein